MGKYSIAVFDVDGTLLDTTEGVLASVLHTIEKFNLKPLSESSLLKFIGPPIQDSFARAYGLEGEILQEMANTFRASYKADHLLKAKPYPGIYDVFDKLQKQGVQLAVATYKRQDYAVEILKHFGFDGYTNVLYGADNENKLKKKDIIKKCIIDLGEKDYSKAVMIGDSDNDAIGAAEIGMKFIGVTYGFDFKSEADVKKFPSIGAAEVPIDILRYFDDINRRPDNED